MYLILLTTYLAFFHIPPEQFVTFKKPGNIKLLRSESLLDEVE